MKTDMWDLRIANPFGRISIRNLLVFVAATIATAFAFIFLTAPVTHAADATWSGDAISYGSNMYQKVADASDNDPRGFTKGTHVYSYTEDPDTSGSDKPQKAHFITFPADADPTKVESAQFTTFDYAPPSSYKNASEQKTISIDKKSDSDRPSSCTVKSIGWLLCPVASFMSSAMDKMYDILSQFLAVRPVSTDTNNPLFKAWSIMRNFANVAFVIAFLIIIYSQVSSIGLSNYGIKRLLPRLVVAAVLVNISYWICAVAVDVSNILGYSVEDLLMGITKTIEKSGSNGAGVLSFESITAAVLSGGTIAAGGTLALLSVGSIGGALYLLLPILVGVLISAVVAIILMAARQALIVILVMIAPLAFVAYLLPNTEKYFEKWKDLFLTMLMLFPIFGVIFGGSELAGATIISNADSIIMLILGMAVKIVPLVFLPFLIKFGGSLIGRIAGMANDRSKGLLDQTRNFSKDQAEARKAKVLGRTDLRRRNVLSRTVQGIDNKRRNREGWNKVNEARADNRWHGDARHEAIDTASREAARTHQTLEQHHDAHWNTHARTNPASMERERMLRVATDQASLAKTQLDGMYEDYKAGNLADATSTLQQNAIVTSQDLAIAGMRQEAAKRKQVADMARALQENSRQIDNQSLLTYAGGVEGAIGEESALSKAVATHRKQFGENVANNLELMKHFNLKTSDKAKLAMGRDISAEKDGFTFTFKADNAQAREAAHDEILSKGSYKEIETLLASTGTYINAAGVEVGLANHEYAGSLSRAAAEKGIPNKAMYWGSKVLDDIGQGRINGQAGINRSIVHHLEEGKAKPEVVAGMDATALARMFKIAQHPSDYASIAKDGNPAQLIERSRALRATAEEIMKNDLLRSKASEKAQETMQAFIDGENIEVDDIRLEELMSPGDRNTP